MDAYLAIASRRDARRYRSDPLPEASVTRILDAGRLSGSAGNRQPWTFVVPTARERLVCCDPHFESKCVTEIPQPRLNLGVREFGFTRERLKFRVLGGDFTHCGQITLPSR